MPPTLTGLTAGIGQDGRPCATDSDHPAPFTNPLANRRWKLAWHRGFDGRADRIQNHLFSAPSSGSKPRDRRVRFHKNGRACERSNAEGRGRLQVQL